MTAVRWKDLPDGQQGAEIRERVSRWLPALPLWLDSLSVYYDDTDAETYASISTRFEQREASLAIHPLYWSLDERGRDVTILHEFSHVILSPIDDLLASLDTVLDAKVKRWFHEMYRQANEGAVSDLSQSMLRLSSKE